MKKFYKINSFVTFSIVKLIDFNSKYIGIFKLKDCLIKSKFLNLDLVEIGTKNNTSICKLISYNKFIYLESKKNKYNCNTVLTKKKTNEFIKKNVKSKEIKFHLSIAENDYKNKIKFIKNFLLKGLKVKITFIVKGREIFKINLIRFNINKIISEVLKFGNLLNSPNFSNRLIFLHFIPKNVKK